MENKREGDLAGKHPDMGIKTIESQDNEGHVKGSKQAEFNECSAQEAQRKEDESELNQKDDRGEMNESGNVGTL